MSLDQVRSLRGGNRNNVISLRNDNRPWVRMPIRMWSGCKILARTLSKDRLNALLVFTPLGISAGVLHWHPTTVFVLNALAIVPVPALLNFATDELSLNYGLFGGLINGIFGRPVELIVRFLSEGRLDASWFRFNVCDLGWHCCLD
jgi:hypothetical protein